jgi:tRNA(adenine34) deaminase
MGRALELARQAGAEGEVPVGAVLVNEAGQVLAQAHNQSIGLCDPTAHAEVLALRQAAKQAGNYRLTGATMYVTLEPCPMCAGAIIWARLARVVYGAADPKAGALGSVLDLTAFAGINHHPLIQGGLLAQESAEILKDFFKGRR